MLLNVASAAQLFHTSDGVAFADLMIEGHRETWPLRSICFCWRSGDAYDVEIVDYH